MPALLELQRSMREQLLAGAFPSNAERLAIYRNTRLSALVNALQLTFPAVQRLVGVEFFEVAAREFIRDHAPTGAYLNDYGAEFPEFLSRFPAAATVSYLADVAQLEWAINRALHAQDVPALELSRLATLDESNLSTVSFRAHPSLSLLRLRSPADAIWRAVLDQDEAAMRAVDLNCTAVHLLVERNATGVQLQRLSAPAWQFIAGLSAGKPFYAALESTSGLQQDDVNVWLADHLASGRFVDLFEK